MSSGGIYKVFNIHNPLLLKTCEELSHLEIRTDNCQRKIPAKIYVFYLTIEQKRIISESRRPSDFNTIF